MSSEGASGICLAVMVIIGIGLGVSIIRSEYGLWMLPAMALFIACGVMAGTGNRRGDCE